MSSSAIVDATRVRALNRFKQPVNASRGGPVVYWMSRDQRVHDNWALLYAQQLARENSLPLLVAFCVVPSFLGATLRHYRFMLRGLVQVEQQLRTLRIPFHLLRGEGVRALPALLESSNASALVLDHSPLREPTAWAAAMAELLSDGRIPLHQVDAHNVVPVWVASNKREYAARTIRPKIHAHMARYLTDFPQVLAQDSAGAEPLPAKIDWTQLDQWLEVDRSVGEVAWCLPGYESGMKTLNEFVEQRLKNFASGRNDPNQNALSNLSPYLHFGQVSAQRCAFVAQQLKARHRESVESFLEELVVRRELSDNFCFYEQRYDSLDAAYPWARDTLEKHASDKREYVYDELTFERALTHDELWNAAQRQLVSEGKMHGYLRMYWAKKILEWSESPAEALRIGIYLNDRYSLDGRDPNGFVGVGWSIYGLHDRGWTERPIFGTIRWMAYSGMRRKFKVDQFIEQYPPSGRLLPRSHVKDEASKRARK